MDRWAQPFEKSAAGLVSANYVIDRVQRRDGTGLVWSRWDRIGGEGKGLRRGGEKELGDRNATFIKLPLLKPFAVFSPLVQQTASSEGRGGALLPSMQGLAMGNRVWVVLASSVLSPSLTFFLL